MQNCHYPFIQGKVSGKSCVVETKEAMAWIYQLGSFGKGSLSRSKPTHFIGPYTTHLRTQPGMKQNEDIQQGIQTVDDPARAYSDNSDRGTDNEHTDSLTSTNTDTSEQEKALLTKRSRTITSEDEPTKKRLRSSATTIPVDTASPPPLAPYTVTEKLQLSLFETIYLTVRMGVNISSEVSLTDQDNGIASFIHPLLSKGGRLPCSSLLESTSKLDSTDLHYLIAYCIMRDSGHVLRSGLSHGAHFLLYPSTTRFADPLSFSQVGPEWSHASHLVYVHPEWTSVCQCTCHCANGMDQKASSTSITNDNTPLTWNHLGGLSRVAGSVGKDVLIVTVTLCSCIRTGQSHVHNIPLSSHVYDQSPPLPQQQRPIITSDLSSFPLDWLLSHSTVSCVSLSKPT